MILQIMLLFLVTTVLANTESDCDICRVCEAGGIMSATECCLDNSLYKICEEIAISKRRGLIGKRRGLIGKRRGLIGKRRGLIGKRRGLIGKRQDGMLGKGNSIQDEY